MERDGVVARGRSREGDFDAFYLRFRPRLLRTMLLTLDDEDLAVEATDEAMTRALQRWSTVSSYPNPEGWTYRVALHWARDRLRRRHREAVIGSGSPDRAPAGADVVEDHALHRAVLELSVKLRAVVVLRYYMDWSVEETAKALGVPRGTVKSRLHRALRRLEDTVRQER
jgi:RNA polymerase sigma factor (sigma-70 family)